MDKQLAKALQAMKSLDQYIQCDHSDAADRLLMASPWLCDWLKKQPDWNRELEFFKQETDANAELEALANQWTLDNEPSVMHDLRVWRNRHMARLMARDALQLSTVRETAKQVSDLADSALQFAVWWAEQFWQLKTGAPAVCPFSGESQRLHVIAMGKHGAQELNLSSDIDLIFAYPCEGETSNGTPHEQYFTRVGRKVIQLLDARTADGFVFRVDMRLRPWGQSGALASNFKALNNYYLQQGRFWERFAMVKARAVTGTAESKYELEQLLSPFVYRRYVDFQAVGALRELKVKIQQEVRRQNLGRNIKLGKGGIREVEFIAQVFQLVRGGQDESLQTRGTWSALTQIAALELLPNEVVNQLINAYDFLRDLEHKIQALRDEQTQMLPTDDSDLERLAANMNEPSVEALLGKLEQVRSSVNVHFSNLIAEEEPVNKISSIGPFVEAWQSKASLTSLKCTPELTDLIMQFSEHPTIQKLTDESLQNLDNFMPILWYELSQFSDGDRRFTIIRPILEAILRRSSYFVLLSENPQAIRELVKLAPLSSWITKQFKENPFLLDELTDLKSLYQLPRQTELHDEIQQLMLRVPEDDLERQMEVLRHFHHARILRAAACEVTNQLPLMKISDYLAWVAEVVVDQALAIVWRQMIAKHGRPLQTNGDWCDFPFGVIAYGKMGGLEISYESDLDLVFIHDADTNGQTEGPSVIENVVFMARLGQKLIHMLSSNTPSGMLYEVDTRLRPSGSSGLLVTSLPSFEKYQRNDAWTWEHQALVRARFIAGDRNLKQKFNALRRDIVCSKRDLPVLKKDIVEMRAKMSSHLSTKSELEGRCFDIKHDAGGIVDLEFIVQYLVLAYANEYPELAKWSDNVRCIEALAKHGLITEGEKGDWMEAYLALRQEVHYAILQNENRQRLIEELPETFVKATQTIVNIWQDKIIH
ncbi:bifunctional [glutamate--ammonia ligase]-adenylyl-L-tyrosine phosphorylase/[glutamate--ammonia-ligase] adenylyltransferase [Reinekea marina]|uniref:Bifunctional glutamine synthetase adenylyltransferase/adenylyl-removing enzyme n=1 Tax=Reinekea marina TaxID=1310421 RepID=A0ABV7WLN4_9GAMM|nr:bifunctional [glutamate--ammonia ligase]-adenylyl-L-tyrosine phosphorylase/[glutamate--ammonia-ligase] adenylyltransferase [Reinekea marina]MDN3648337.1 bifunctional [glutamate--ammonia ligase]-adenylyl-L-tyrosine phosphorylase/[glutamate--ammonia-ligase] adenylyltransferase [Reinekea marina]